MKRLSIPLILMIVLLCLVNALPLVAQDATATAVPQDTTGSTDERVTCDSSLILLYGVAQRYFGFTSSANVNTGTLEYGQYIPLFNASTGTTSSDGIAPVGGNLDTDTTGAAAPNTSSTGSTGAMQGEGSTADSTTGGNQPSGPITSENNPETSGVTTTPVDEANAASGATAIPDAGNTDINSAGSIGSNPATMLNPPTIAGENPACTILRGELEGYFATGLQTPDWDTRFRDTLTGGNIGSVDPNEGTGEN